jgi:hypothetical protein
MHDIFECSITAKETVYYVCIIFCPNCVLQQIAIFFAKKSEKVPKIFQVVAFGATTLSIMTLSIMTLGIMTLSIMTLSIMTLSLVTLSIMTLNMNTLNITLCIKHTMHNDTQNDKTQHNTIQNDDT